MKEKFTSKAQQQALFAKEAVVVELELKSATTTYVTPEGALVEDSAVEPFLQNKFLAELDKIGLKYHVLSTDQDRLVFAVPVKSENYIKDIKTIFFVEGRQESLVSLKIYSHYKGKPPLSERIAMVLGLNPERRAAQRIVKQLRS